MLGVPVDYDGGEQVQPCHPEMLAFTCPVADFTLAPDAQSVLEGVMGFSFVQPDLGATLHIGVQQPVDDEQRPFRTRCAALNLGTDVMPELA